MSDKKELDTSTSLSTEYNNSLTSLVTGLSRNISLNDVRQTSRLDTLFFNNRYELLFYNRTLLSQLYIEHGIIQTLVDQPVDDAFRGGITIKSQQLDPDDIAKLSVRLKEEEAIEKISQTMKWARLYGGGGLVLIANQDFKRPFNMNTLGRGSEIKFYAADLWELNFNWTGANQLQDYIDDVKNPERPYNFYGKEVHKTRVIPFKAKEAPSWVRRRMRGWGMPVVERMVRSFNQYLKNNNVIFELLDEAKIDVYKITDFNSALITKEGTEAVQNRIQLANQVKNYINALTMDAEDDYEQKQMNFAGLSDMLQQIRIGIASDLRMPVTKLFGVSSAGFNSGEDDIENYNAMIETEIRSKCHAQIIKVIQVYCQIEFGFIPDDIEIEFKPLRVLSAEQEENVKTQKFSRLALMHDKGIISDEEFQEAINAGNLADIKIGDVD